MSSSAGATARAGLTAVALSMVLVLSPALGASAAAPVLASPLAPCEDVAGPTAGTDPVARCPPAPLISYRLWWVDLGPLAARQAVEHSRQVGPSVPLGGGTWLVTADLLPQLVQALQERRPPGGDVATSQVSFPQSQAAAGEMVGTLGLPVQLRLGARPVARSSAAWPEPDAEESSLSVELLARSVDTRGRVETRVEIEVVGAGSVIRYAHTLWLSDSGAPVVFVIHEAGPTAYALAIGATRMEDPPSQASTLRFAALDAFESQAFDLLRAQPAREERLLVTRVGVEAGLSQGAPQWKVELSQPLTPRVALDGAAGWQGKLEGPADAHLTLRVRLLYELDLLAALSAAAPGEGTPLEPAVGFGFGETTRPLPDLALSARVLPLVYAMTDPSEGPWVQAPALWSARVTWREGPWEFGVEGAHQWPDHTTVTLDGTVHLAPWLAARVGYRYGWENESHQAVIGLLITPSSLPASGMPDLE